MTCRAKIVSTGCFKTVADKSNEIPAAQTLLDRLELDGTIALMNALHTQEKTARAIVREGGGDYVLFVKDNQAGLLQQARNKSVGAGKISTTLTRATLCN